MQVDPSQRVVIVGAGPAGLATAIELAQRGVPSTVLEKRGAAPTRTSIFAVVPPFADRLAALDPAGSLTKHLYPLERMDSDDLDTGRHGERTFDTPLAPDPTRSRGDMGALVRAADSPKKSDADHRRWATVGIDTLEGAMRALAQEQYGGLIDIRYDTGVDAVRQGDGWAEAVLTPAEGASGPADAVRGAMLVDASGRNLLGADMTVYPETAHWVGTRVGPRGAGLGTQRVSKQDPDGGPPQVAISLPTTDRTLVWTQVPEAMDPEVGRSILRERAPLTKVDELIPDDTRVANVAVQLKTSNEPARGRILAVGDSTRSPYFMTSTGAASAVVHDAPRAVDAILAVLNGTADVASASQAYADAVRGANEQLLDVVRPRLLGDLGIKRADAQAPTVVPATS